MSIMEEVRHRIESCSREEAWNSRVSAQDVRDALKYQVLTGCRLSEVVGKWRVTRHDFSLSTEADEEALIIQVHSAKNDGVIRYVALPTNPKYEPWTMDLVSRVKACQDQAYEQLFDFSESLLKAYAHNLFSGLVYDIRKYKTIDESKVPDNPNRKHAYRDVPASKAPLVTHGLRHLRARELLNFYRFDGLDLALYLGWSLESGESDTPKMAMTYTIGDPDCWRRYFSKLLKPRVLTISTPLLKT